MKSFYLTDAGKVRSHNEDSVIILKNQSGDYLMAVADGMGGHSAGEIASSITISHLSKCFTETFNNFEIDIWERSTYNAVVEGIFWRQTGSTGGLG